MSTFDDLKSTIASIPELSGLLQEAAVAAKEYVDAGRSIWEAEDKKAVAAGATGIPFRVEEHLINDKPVSATSFVIASLIFGGRFDSGIALKDVVDELKVIRDDYQAKRAALTAAP